MSPNAYLQWNENTGLLEGFQGEYEGEEPVFVWTYSVFEELIQHSITPSMYGVMAAHVEEFMTKEELYEVQGGDYCPGDLEACAVDAYYDLPTIEKIRLHEQELVNLRAAKRTAEAKESAAIDAMLEEHRPFDDSSPIATEYADFMRGIIERERKNIDRLDREIHEEDQWRGGHEEGAEDDTHLGPYDPMEEY